MRSLYLRTGLSPLSFYLLSLSRTTAPGPLSHHSSRRRHHTRPAPDATAPDAQPTAFDRSKQEDGAVASPAAAADEIELPTGLRKILERRRAAGRLVAGVAAASDSDMFKGPTTGKPEAKKWDAHLSSESLSRGPCNLKKAALHLKKPGLISLGGGLPSSEYFPFASLSMRVPSPPHFSEASTLSIGRSITIGKYDAAAAAAAATSTAAAAATTTATPPSFSPLTPHPPRVPSDSNAYDLSIALNYAQSTGSAQLLRFVTEHTELVHDPPYADWRCAATIGSTGALEQALRMLCERSRADSVLTDDFSFSTALETMAPLGIRAVGVRMDAEGLVPEAIDELLSRWDRPGGRRKPHVLYTVPSGQNPTGATQGARRRRDVYEVCREHDLIILEDEPYYFLQLPPYRPRAARTPAVSSSPSTPSPSSLPDDDLSSFLSSLLPSLLSLDVDGRVLRMDSFSKMLVPGARTGWVTGPRQLVDRFVMHSEVANQGPSGFSQLILHRLLDETWGHHGFLRWLANLRREYARRRDVILDACEEFLPAEAVSWDPPRAGMFLWLRINHGLHPHAATHSILQIEEEIFNACIDKGVLVARGSWFHTGHPDHPLPGLFFRATFAAASEENMAEAVRRFGDAVRQSFRMK